MNDSKNIGVLTKYESFEDLKSSPTSGNPSKEEINKLQKDFEDFILSIRKTFRKKSL